MNLESILEVLGLHLSDLPISRAKCVNLYINLSKEPLAKLYLNDGKFKLRFGDVVPCSVLDPLPSGGIRITPTNH